MMFLWIEFILAITTIATLIICYALILAKLKPSNEPPENMVFPPIPEESNYDSSKQRRMEMVEKLKQEKIEKYYNRKKRKIEDT